MELPEKPKTRSLSTVLIGTAIICLLIGGILGYAISSFTASSQISDLQSRLSTLEKQVSNLQPLNNQVLREHHLCSGREFLTASVV